MFVICFIKLFIEYFYFFIFQGNSLKIQIMDRNWTFALIGLLGLLTVRDIFTSVDPSSKSGGGNQVNAEKSIPTPKMSGGPSLMGPTIKFLYCYS